MSKPNNTGYIILAIIVFIFGVYFFDKLLSPKSQKLDTSQVLEWKPPKLKFADDSMVKIKKVGVQLSFSPTRTQKEVDERRDKFREEELDRIIPKTRGHTIVEQIELSEQGFTKYVVRWDDKKLQSIKYLSHKEEYRLIDGRDFFISCRDDGLCTSSFWDSAHGVSIRYVFGSDLEKLDEELEFLVRIPKEIEESIKKYYSE
ncbi:hypothetical protein B9T10_07330 [Wohlfahrtiimonas chitiniclastica]|uniref:hypothetical protein n=1 Tax=Wohlfahrtiimonas chitiniclastica TaxID=400946 RepID=UPI000B996661|nr:hypothetical protein [Wohlfahrtiimonas chitiniclastica]MBS7815677.1 hypothetical protein [Wohlfahrtiimonas chitiniclastica]OYQ83989.1 hypothetical protein B9T14_07125 [Wohlfahrtiimonas chitiniclastica]OYQ84828.1 hypothetical protein B9T15_07155 [Wohlfahrtiimonas chitiniclastica]OYQ89101.1 hypothetical protein B9T10_07330 [Wohlfahrtiimonas chitiniclastica]